MDLPCAAPTQIALSACEGKDAAWNGFNVLHTAAARVAGLDLGFGPAEGSRDAAGILRPDMQVVYLLGADECDLGASGGAFTVYQGSHGDHGAARADVILPGSAYGKEPSPTVNTKGAHSRPSRLHSLPVRPRKTGLSSAHCRHVRARHCPMTI